MAPDAPTARRDDPVAAARALAEEVRGGLETWERDGRYPRAVAAGSGLTGLFSPSSAGGRDLSYEEGMRVFEELGRADAAFAFSLSMHNAVAAAVARAAPEPVRSRWAAELAAGRALGGFSLTEPHAGSDATAITTRAARDGGRWRLRGRKAWVSLAGEADLSLVVAKTSDEPGHRDIAMFAVEGAAAGLRVERLYRLPVARYLPIGEVVLDDVEADEVVPPGQGLRAALGAIDVARCDIAAIACGLHADAIDRALRWARRREAFGRTVLDFQGIQWMLADAETDLVAGRLLVDRAARLLGTPEGGVAVAHAKRFAPDAALRAAVACSEVMGAYGWLEEAGLVRAIALAKMLQVVDGTAEVQRIVVARDLVRRAGEAAGPSALSSGSPPG